MLEATRAYFREQDPLEEFFSTCCVFEPGAWVRAGELREAYERFAEEGGSRPVGGRRWTGGLTARGAEVGRNERGRYWMRVRLRSGGEEAAAPDDEQGSAVGCR